MSLFVGQCLCGAVGFQAAGSAKNRCYCHCRSCQKASGGAVVPWATFPADGWLLQKGTIRYVQSSEKVRRGFCALCGTTLTYEHADHPDQVDVAVAALENAHTLAPEFHIWVSEKFPGLEISDDLPQYPEWRKD